MTCVPSRSLRSLGLPFIALGITGASSAADLYWDANGATTGTGGNGIWNTASTWRDGSATGTLQNWADGNAAVFGGTAGTVTLGSSISLTQLKVTTTNYIVGATADTGNTISFSGSYSDSVRAIDANVANTTIRAKITGTISGGLVVFNGSNITTPASAGRLSLENTANDFTGDITVLGGNLSATGAAMGVAANKVILKGGALFQSNGAGTSNNTFNRNIAVDAASGISTSVASGGNQTLELSGNITGSANLTRYGSLTGTGAVSRVIFSGDMSGYSGTFSNQAGDVVVQTSSASAGKWVASGGTLSFANTSSLYNGNSASWTKENITVNSGATLALNAGGSGEFSGSQVTTLLSNLSTDINNNGLRAGSIFRLNVADSSSITLAGNLSNSSGTGGGAWTLHKTGTGNLTLTGSNSYTGQTLVQGGSLTFDGGSLDGSGTAAASRSFNIGSGGSVEIKNNAQVTFGGWVGLGFVDNTGSGSLTLSSGSMWVKGLSGGTPNDRGMVLGEYTNTSGSFTMNGGALTVDNAMWLGQNGAGSWSLSGGNASVKKLSFANAAAASGILNLTGGTLSIGSGGITKGSGTATLNMGGGTLSSSASWSTTVAMALTGSNGNFSVATEHSITLGGALTGAGGLIKKGSGTLSLTTANSYAGSTMIQQGTLSLGAAGTVGSVVVQGTSSGGSGTLDVSAKSGFTQANLSGNGSVNIGAGKTVGITTTLSPGFSIGTLSITGNLALGGTTTMELGGNGGVAGLDSDLVEATGTITLAGILDIISYGPYDFTQPASYQLFEAASFDGDFAAVSVGGHGLTLSGDLWSGQDGGTTYSLDQNSGLLTVVPEPAFTLLGGIGLLALLRRRHR